MSRRKKQCFYCEIYVVKFCELKDLLGAAPILGNDCLLLSSPIRLILPSLSFSPPYYSGQSYKAVATVNYNYRVVLTRKSSNICLGIF